MKVCNDASSPVLAQSRIHGRVLYSNILQCQSLNEMSGMDLIVISSLIALLLSHVSSIVPAVIEPIASKTFISVLGIGMEVVMPVTATQVARWPAMSNEILS